MIPLRPVTVGEILDGAFTAIRRNPKATLGISAVLLTIFAVISAIVSATMQNPATIKAPGAHATTQQMMSYFGHVVADVLPVFVALIVLNIVIDIIVTGLLTIVIGRSVLGHRVTAGEAWRIALPRLGALLGALALYLLIALVTVLVPAIVVVALGAAGLAGGGLAFVIIVGLLATFCAEVWFGVRFSLLPPAVILERRGPASALARSWRLTRRSFWRVFLILLLTEIIVLVAGFLLELPFGFIAGIMSTGGAATSPLGLAASAGIVSLIITSIGSIVAGAVTRPILAGVTVLLYVDLRIRREGLDLVLQSATGGDLPPGDEFASVWQPPVPGQTPPHSRSTAGPPPSAGPPPAW